MGPDAVTALFVSWSGGLGGAERLLLDALAGAGARAVLACPEGPLADAARTAGVPVLVTPQRSLHVRARPVRALGDLLVHARQTRTLARDLAADVVIGWSLRSALGSTAVARGPERIHFHNDLPTSAGMARAARAAARRADTVVCASATVAEALGLPGARVVHPGVDVAALSSPASRPDRKSTRLNSSHPSISYAVFCLKKKNNRHHRLVVEKD